MIDTTINYTNVCNVHCTFCAFFRPEKHEEGYTMSHDAVLARVKYAADLGATQIMIQGGVNPELRHRLVRAAVRARGARISRRGHPFALGLRRSRVWRTSKNLPVREVLLRLQVLPA